MELSTWRVVLSKKSPSYSHFDKRVSRKSFFRILKQLKKEFELKHPQKKITYSDAIAMYAFYPFIHYKKENRRVKNGHRDKPKARDIYYSAHMDSWIYRIYAAAINEKYNKRVKECGIDSVAVAYRTDLIGKSNVNFANEAFTFIQGHKSCYVAIIDFTNFFDNLSHSYLKKRLCDLYSQQKLPNDLYAVYKNITRFSFVELNDLLRKQLLENNRVGLRKFNSLERVLTPQEFRESRKELVKKPSEPGIGIPQGSPISAVLANVYMLEADKKVTDLVRSFNGFYMRYSDDLIIVDPSANGLFVDHLKQIREIFALTPNLKCEDNKTKIFRIYDERVENKTDEFIPNGKKGKNVIEFLGFAFDGRYIRIRDKTVSKYYNKLYRKIKTIVKRKGYTPDHKRISCRNLYDKYSYKGSLGQKRKTGQVMTIEEGNFIDYVLRAKSVFSGQPVDTVAKRHMQKIRKRLNRMKEK